MIKKTDKIICDNAKQKKKNKRREKKKGEPYSLKEKLYLVGSNSSKISHYNCINIGCAIRLFFFVQSHRA